ncbi:MAG: InlB B-repeat-containing protein [Rikenellaceae bacterium]|nr:InlB B-repeat-containing protein [Rikenellaceae bacterium]
MFNRIKHNTKLLLGLLLGTTLSLAGCSNDFVEPSDDNKAPQQSEYIKFAAKLNPIQSKPTRSTASSLSIESEEWPVNLASTRTNPVNHLSDYTAGIVAIDDATTPLINNQEHQFYGDELQPVGSSTRWKSITGDEVKIHAYGPYDKLKSKLDITDNTPRIKGYEVSTTASEQIDIIAESVVAETNPTGFTGPYHDDVSLVFDHVLTAVRFRIGFACRIVSVEVTNVLSKGDYNLATESWENVDTYNNYSINFGESGVDFAANALLNDSVLTDEGNDEKNTFMMIPQTLHADSKIILTYLDGSTEKTISAPIGKTEWYQGKLITYTLHQTSTPNHVYLDLAAGNVEITQSSDGGLNVTGKVYEYGTNTTRNISKTYTSSEKAYVHVYQSASFNRATSGVTGEGASATYTLPSYKRVQWNGGDWSNYIVGEKIEDEDFVTKVIDNWTAAVADGDDKREASPYWINIHNTGNNKTINLTIEDLYSKYQENNTSRVNGGLAFHPQANGSKLHVNTIGDNRFGNIFYLNKTHNNGTEIIFEGTGSLTVADVNGYKGSYNGDYGLPSGQTGYYGNHWNAAIGANDSQSECYGIIFNSGIVFAGSTKAENCSAIGAGGNGHATITINGGIITAIASTTGTAIGGGIGFHSAGGKGYVYINGGNVYAYNFANRWSIPSAAIGGAGSSKSSGNTGVVEITGGYVYAQSALGTAIGGGSSQTVGGGEAQVTISGGEVIARSVAANGIAAGAGIGGGSACSGGTNTSSNKYNGGTATITIKGNPIIRTGSIGGGDSHDPQGGKIGSAQINISGGDIQAQFVMASGASSTPKFEMTGGMIRNSDTEDPDYYHIKEHGGAVYLEDGKFIMSGGEIRHCKAEQGGAVYIKGSSTTTFTMSGGNITDCYSYKDGGAVYLEGGSVAMSKDALIFKNIAKGGHGGGVFVKEGNFAMSDESSIKANTALHDYDTHYGGNGGGVYVTSKNSDVSVTINSGAIIENTADLIGGGLCVDMSATSYKATVKVGTEGSGSVTNPNISKNYTILSGGGLYASGLNANISIYSGKIAQNITSAYVPNQDVANEGGMVTLEGGDVNHKVVTFDGNGGTAKVSGNTTEMQKIVTATNSKLIIPEFERFGYTLTGWKDINGTEYTNDQVMNISYDITLYAQWQMN